MNREELQKLGLSSEQVDGVMTAYGKDVSETNKLKEQVTTLTTERDGYKEQLGARDKDIKDLKKSVADNDELTTKFNDLQTKYDKETKDLSTKLAESKKSAAVSKALAGVNARDADDLRKFLDDDKLALDADDNLTGLDEQIEQLQKDKAYLFTGKPKPHYDPNGGGKVTTDLETAITTGEGNLTELLANQSKE